MYADALHYCRSCPECAIVAGGRKPEWPPLDPIPVQIVGIDIMDLPRSESRKKHGLVLQDILTKWPPVYHMEDQKTAHIAKLLVE